MSQQQIHKACQGKKKVDGGLNVSDMRKMLQDIVKVANRSELESMMCTLLTQTQQSPAQSQRLSPSPAQPVPQLKRSNKFKVRKGRTGRKGRKGKGRSQSRSQSRSRSPVHAVPAPRRRSRSRSPVHAVPAQLSQRVSQSPLRDLEPMPVLSREELREQLFKSLKPKKRRQRGRRTPTNPIIFLEPATQIKWYNSTSEPHFTVTDSFLDVLEDGPQEYEGSWTNAYVFGPLKNLAEYDKLTSHMNDVASTGLVHLGRLKSSDAQEIERLHDKHLGDHYAFLSEAPESVIFIGDTVGGDVGADLYVSQNSQGEIDSLIIDNNYFFR